MTKRKPKGTLLKRGPKSWEPPDEKVLEQYGALGLSFAEIANIQGIKYQLLKRAIDKDPKICIAIKRGRAKAQQDILNDLWKARKEFKSEQAKITSIIYSLKRGEESELQKLRGTKLQQDIRASKAVQKKAELESRRLELEIKEKESQMTDHPEKFQSRKIIFEIVEPKKTDGK